VEAPPPREMPVFPLGSVLLPGQLLPLQVFEPRYRVLLFDLRDEQPAEFVVALIERGSEVGGGDVRTDVGCVARIERTEDLPGGRTLVLCVGTERMHIVEWLEEDPYPRALVRPAPSQPDPAGGPPAELTGRADALARDVGDLAERLGAPAWPGPALSDDPDERLWQLALLAPLGTLDRQRLLAEDDPVVRWERLAESLEEQRDLLEARLRWESSGD